MSVTEVTSQNLVVSRLPKVLLIAASWRTVFFAADFSIFSPHYGSPGFAKQFGFRLNNFLNVVTEVTFSRDGMTPALLSLIRNLVCCTKFGNIGYFIEGS